jgi:hypothetical protein
MFKKQYLGYFLIGIGGITGAMIVLLFFVSREPGMILPLFLLAAVGCAMVGAVLSFTQLLDHLVKPIVEVIDEDVKDDIEDIVKARVTGAQVMFILTGGLVLVFLFLILKLHKFDAAWGGLPVYIVAFVVAAIGILIVVNTTWFQDQSLRTPLIVYLIPAAGLAISLLLGLGTENPRSLSLDTTAEQVVYNDFTPLAVDFIRVPFSSGVSMSCDGDGCLAVVLIVALVAITLVLVLGSAYIPHFWILSGVVLLSILVIITIHEIRLRPDAPRRMPRPAVEVEPSGSSAEGSYPPVDMPDESKHVTPPREPWPD